MAHDPWSRETCDFCRIVDGVDDAVVLLSADAWLAIEPIDPASPGHTLIVPRLHSKDLWQASPEVARRVVLAAQVVGKAMQAVLSPDGLNMITSAGRAATQTVFHTHVHIVPRWFGDHAIIEWPNSGARNPKRDQLASELKRLCATSSDSY